MKRNWCALIFSVALFFFVSLGIFQGPFVNASSEVDDPDSKLQASALATSYVEINETNFPDATFRQRVIWKDDDYDGKLSPSECAAVKEINLRSLNVTSLKGIEYFTKLTELTVSWNKNLTEIDISKNTELVILRCDSCALEKLDVSKNTKLKILDCSGNDLSVLNLSNNLQLEELAFSWNNISSINVSKQTKLTTLNCDYNQLTDLNVGTLTNLKILNCSNNLLTDLNINKNTKLETLYCHRNKLATFNTNNNPNLIYLNCGYNNLTGLNVAKNTKLTTLICSGQDIMSLDVLSHYDLEHLECAYNGLTTLNIWNNEKLKILNCSNNSLTELEVARQKDLEELNCVANKIKLLDLESNLNLSELSCFNNQLVYLGLGKKPKLTSLSCAKNNLKKLKITNCPYLLSAVKDLVLEDGRYYVQPPYNDSTVFLSFDSSVQLIQKPNSVLMLQASVVGKTKIRLTWRDVDNSDGFLIYAKKSGQYGYVGMTTKGDTFLDTNAMYIDYNYYWVFPYVKDSNGKMHVGDCTKYVYAKGNCPAVQNLRANGTTGKVTLYWDASDGADGYLIYGIRPGQKYGYIGMTTKGTTFTDTKASKSDWTFYWVFPYYSYNSKMIVGGTSNYVYSKAR